MKKNIKNNPILPVWMPLYLYFRMQTDTAAYNNVSGWGYCIRYDTG